MKFKRHLKLAHGLEQIDIVPLIDITFLLLIFLTLSSFFTFQTGINVKLPKAVTSDILKDENIVISITSEDIMYFNGTVSSIKELTKELSTPENKTKLILIKADRRASVGRIVDIWDLCRNLGIERINIATNQGK